MNEFSELVLLSEPGPHSHTHNSPPTPPIFIISSLSYLLTQCLLGTRRGPSPGTGSKQDKQGSCSLVSPSFFSLLSPKTNIRWHLPQGLVWSSKSLQREVCKKPVSPLPSGTHARRKIGTGKSRRHQRGKISAEPGSEPNALVPLDNNIRGWLCLSWHAECPGFGRVSDEPSLSKNCKPMVSFLLFFWFKFFKLQNPKGLERVAHKRD
jgi:hypothetical protein